MAVYALIPPNITSPDIRAYQDQVTSSIVHALEAAKVTHAVVLSSIGADKADKTGPVIGLHHLEKRVAQVPKLSTLCLRAGYFMENTLPQAGVIKTMGKMVGPERSDLSMPLIASRDIGVAAAGALEKLDFTGHETRELLGQRDLTSIEIARIIGAAIGKTDLAYVQLPADQMIQALTQIGMSKNMATLLCEMADALNSGYMRAIEPRSTKNTTPTSFEDFVQKVFVPAYKGQAARA